MNVRDWKHFLRVGEGRTIGIAQVSQEMAARVGAVSRTVYLGHPCAVKAITKHRLKPEHFPMIHEVVDFGAALVDPNKPNHLIFLHYDPFVWNRWFEVVVKRDNEKRKLFVATFFKIWPREVTRRRKKWSVIREGREW